MANPHAEAEEWLSSLKVGSVPRAVLRQHLQPWLLDLNVTPTCPSGIPCDGDNLATWKESRLISRTWASEVAMPLTLNLRGEEALPRWNMEMFLRLQRTMFVFRFPGPDRQLLDERLLRFSNCLNSLDSDPSDPCPMRCNFLPPSRVRVDIGDTITADQSTDLVKIVDMPGLELVTSSQNISPEALAQCSVCDILGAKGLIEAANWSQQTGQKFDRLLVLSTWIQGEVWQGAADLTSLISPFPNLQRLQLFFNADPITGWEGLRELVRLRELRIDCFSLKKPTTHPLKGVLAWEYCPKLAILVISRGRTNGSFDLLRGRTVRLPELWLIHPQPSSHTKFDTDGLIGLDIGKVCVNVRNLPPAEREAWIKKLSDSAGQTPVVCEG